MTADDLLISYAAAGTLRWHATLKTYSLDGVQCEQFLARQINDLVLYERLVIRDDGLVVPVTQAEVA